MKVHNQFARIASWCAFFCIDVVLWNKELKFCYKKVWKIYVKMMCRCRRWSCHHCSLKWSQIMRCLWSGLNRPHCGMTSLLIGLEWQPSGNLPLKKSFNVISTDTKAIKLVLPIEFRSQSDNDSIYIEILPLISQFFSPRLTLGVRNITCHCVRAFL